MSGPEASWPAEYARRYEADYGFEAVLVRCRHRFLARLVASLRPRAVVEVGCGLEQLLAEVAACEAASGPLFEAWVTVEPSPRFAQAHAAAAGADGRARLVAAPLEAAVAEVLEACGPSRPDLVLCASLLHEVPDPAALLAALARLCGPGTLLHVSAPNARSLHRRLALAMGVISDLHEPSERNRRFRQPRVYDLGALCAELASAGFRVERTGGLFLKPFDHRHMAEVPFLDEAMADGLARLGEELPDLAAEVWAHARLARPPDRA